MSESRSEGGRVSSTPQEEQDGRFHLGGGGAGAMRGTTGAKEPSTFPSHRILAAPLGRQLKYAHFTDEEVEAQRGEGREKAGKHEADVGEISTQDHMTTPQGAKWGTDRGQQGCRALQGKAACGEGGPRWNRMAASPPGSLGEPHPSLLARMETLKVKLRPKPALGK